MELTYEFRSQTILYLSAFQHTRNGSNELSMSDFELAVAEESGVTLA